MSRRYAFLFLALLQLNFLLGCSSGPNGATALSEVESAHADLIAAYNTCNAEAFTSRFWRWFDAFLVMKYVHFAKENYFPDVEVTVVLVGDDPAEGVIGSAADQGMDEVMPA